MMRLIDTDLPQTAIDALSQWQQKINVLPDYAEQVKVAKELWKRKPKTVFKQVRKVLATMHGDQCQCAFCETSCADEVEHYRPKDLFPDRTFLWENYLFSCGKCNITKSTQFAIFTTPMTDWVELQRADSAAAIRPVPGDPLLLNPRYDDPIDYLLLDINGATLGASPANWKATFEWKPSAKLDSRDWHRADYTVRVVGLNTRSALLAARRDRYHSMLIALDYYVTQKRNGIKQDKLRHIPDAIRAYPNPSVWEAMKRQSADVTDLTRLFAAAPEALTW